MPPVVIGESDFVVEDLPPSYLEATMDIAQDSEQYSTSAI